MQTVVTRFRTGTVERPKTVGILVDPTDTGFESLESWSSGEALTIYKLMNKLVSDDDAAAKGKVIFVNRSTPVPEVACFQANSTKAEPAWCGNAYAAVAAHLYQCGQSPEFFVCNGEKLTVKADVTADGGDFKVAQQWKLQRDYIVNEPGPDIEMPTIYLNFLNDYRVIVAPDTEQFDRQCEELGSRLGGLRLTEKICLLHPESGRVKFFTSSYVHGGAPVTGLCSLALLKNKSNWLGQGKLPDLVKTPSGEEMLPVVEVAGSEIIMDINDINVNLKNI